jgi:CubicO group peptidase (beta-lactamase class C family)
MRSETFFARFTICLLLFVFSLQSFGTEQPTRTIRKRFLKIDGSLVDPKQLDSVITDAMKKAMIPGLSLAVVDGQEISYKASFGFRNKTTYESVNDSTVFRAASLSKPLFAYCVAMLADEGLIDLDKPLFEYLPHPDLLYDPRAKKITARMVLNHTSGLPNYRGWYGTSINAEPGSTWMYSGEGFYYLQMVAEYLTGTPFDHLMQEKVFYPLHMYNTSYEWQVRFNTNYATAHDRFGYARPRPMQLYGSNAAASLITTAEDYAKFVMAVMNQEGLSRRMWDQVFAPYTKVPAHPVNNLYWSLGWGIMDDSEKPVFFHWGDDYDFKCFVAGYPNQRKAFVFLTNSENGLNIKDKLMTYTIGGKAPSFYLMNYYQIN